MERPGAFRDNRRRRANRQSDRDRSGAHRPHAALESRDVHRRLRADPRTLRHAARIARARLQAGPLQLQREGRPLRSLPGRRPAPHRNEFPARRVRHLRSLPRPPLQRRNAGCAIQGPLDFRSAGHADRRRAENSGKYSANPREARNAGGRRPRLHPAGPVLHHAFRRRGAAHQARAANFRAARPAARSTFWTSPPPACTSTT